MSERGVFAVDRGIWDHPLLADRNPFSRREAWIWLISEAAWKPHRRRIAGQSVDLTRGQIAHSLRHLAERWRWSVKRVRVFLEHLKSDAMIDTVTDTGITVITICNYDEYQKVSLPKGTDRGTQEGTAGAQQGHSRGTIREDKEYKEDIKEDSSSPRSESIIDRWPKDFREQFWAAYPRPVGKKSALRKLELIRKSGEIEFEALIAAARKAGEGIDDPKFIPHPTTWLNQGRYLDGTPSAGIATATGPPPGLTAQQQRDWERGWRPGMPSSEELSRRTNGKAAGTTGRSVDAHEQGELLAACPGDDEADQFRQGGRH